MDDKGFVWNNNALEALFELLQIYQPVFRGGRKNSRIYREMADELKEFGPTHTEGKKKKRAGQGWVVRWKTLVIKALRPSVLYLAHREHKGLHPNRQHRLFLFDQGFFSGGKKRRRDIMEELVEMEKKKLAVMEKMAEDSATFQNRIIE